MKSDQYDYLEHLNPLNLHGKALLDLFDRMEEIEENVYKKRKTEVSLGQRILLLEYSAILEKILEAYPKQKDQVSFLSILLDGDIDNIKKDLAFSSFQPSINFYDY